MPLRADATLGPYRLVRPLGRGSMGEVHLAIDSRTQQPRALKVLTIGHDLSAADHAQARQRFMAEAQAARRLSHPDIVNIYEAGEHAGTAWLAMELLSGCDLGRYTHMSRLLPEPVVLDMVARLARALAHAHGLGVVHRDIKPGNVMLDLPARRVKLTDFGVAGLADMSRTRTGVVLGTPLYMAPEQLAGAAADARSDLYSLGVLMFQLLSGRLPHEHASLGELLRAVAREPAPDLRTLRPSVSPALAAIVAQALHKQPAQRHAHGNQLADELAELAHSGRAGAARPAGQDAKSTRGA
jgi:eukaryotic-like serine/threonine-protein kinase